MISVISNRVSYFLNKSTNLNITYLTYYITTHLIYGLSHNTNVSGTSFEIKITDVSNKVVPVIKVKVMKYTYLSQQYIT